MTVQLLLYLFVTCRVCRTTSSRCITSWEPVFIHLLNPKTGRGVLNWRRQRAQVVFDQRQSGWQLLGRVPTTRTELSWHIDPIAQRALQGDLLERYGDGHEQGYSGSGRDADVKSMIDGNVLRKNAWKIDMKANYDRRRRRYWVCQNVSLEVEWWLPLE